jgi:predicted component of type VI protein secretion system
MQPQLPVLKIRLTLRGRLIRSYDFRQETVSIGRDPSADVHLENAGVSRAHARIEWAGGRYELVDCGSANGTFLNDAPVARAPLGDGDMFTIGKFCLWAALPAERPAATTEARPGAPAFEGTTILTRGQLARVMAAAREEESEPESERAPFYWSSGAGLALALGATLAVGIALGALVLGRIDLSAVLR